MKIQVRIAIFLLGCLVTVQATVAQDLAEDLQRIERRYASADQLTAEVVYRVFSDDDTETPLQEEDGKVVRKGSKIYQKIGSLETRTTPDYQLVADHSNKLIVISQGVKNDNAFAGLSSAQLKELLKFCEEVTYKALDDHQAQYVMKIPSGEYRQVSLIFDRESFWLNKITLFYRQSYARSQQTALKSTPRVEIGFTQISTSKKVDDSIFAYQNLLTKSHNQYSLTKEYEHYQLINQLR